jgi:hypothetical protein
MPDELEILKLRAQRLELGSTLHQLKQAGRDGAAAQLLKSRKPAELEDATERINDSETVTVFIQA